MVSEGKRAYASETIGTFALVFAGTGAVIVDGATNALGQVGISLVFGLIVFAMVYAFGNVSGAHINPAVTIALASVKKFPAQRVPFYILSQLFGAVLASALWLSILGKADRSYLGATLPNPAFGWEASFILELAMTFFLMLVIMGAVASSAERGASALAIGAAVAMDALFGGPVSGASMNPARSFGPALIAQNFAYHWIYWLAPILGALSAALTYAALKKEQC